MAIRPSALPHPWPRSGQAVHGSEPARPRSARGLGLGDACIWTVGFGRSICGTGRKSRDTRTFLVCRRHHPQDASYSALVWDPTRVTARPWVHLCGLIAGVADSSDPSAAGARNGPDDGRPAPAVHKHAGSRAGRRGIAGAEGTMRRRVNPLVSTSPSARSGCTCGWCMGATVTMAMPTRAAL